MTQLQVAYIIAEQRGNCRHPIGTKCHDCPIENRLCYMGTDGDRLKRALEFIDENDCSEEFSKLFVPVIRKMRESNKGFPEGFDIRPSMNECLLILKKAISKWSNK